MYTYTVYTFQKDIEILDRQIIQLFCTHVEEDQVLGHLSLNL